MKRQKQLPKLGFRNATKDEKHATCRRFINGVAALPIEKRGKMPLAELLQELAEAEAAKTRVAGLRAALNAAVAMSDEKTARLCRTVTSGVQLYFTEFGANGMALQPTAAETQLRRKPVSGPPGQPTDLRASASAGAVKLRWKSPTPRSIYIIEYTENPNSEGAWVRDSRNLTTRSSHLITDLKPNTPYWFRVRAQNTHGEGPWSESLPARSL
jgi:hypothetical protein